MAGPLEKMVTGEHNREKSMRPIIGITMSLDRGGLIRAGVDYSFIRREYGEQVHRAGGEPLFLDPSIDPAVAASLCHGFVVSGGEDIDPSLYGQTKRYIKATEPVERSRWERRLIEECDARGRPILGICYGAQLLNVHYGGTLYRDIYAEQGTRTEHGTSGGSALNSVAFEHDFLGFSEGEIVQTVHRHHQAVRKLAPGFQVMARAEDGLIEAIAGHGHFGVQWHAESDDTAPTIYRRFVEGCGAQIMVAPEARATILQQ